MGNTPRSRQQLPTGIPAAVAIRWADANAELATYMHLLDYTDTPPLRLIETPPRHTWRGTFYRAAAWAAGIFAVAVHPGATRP